MRNRINSEPNSLESKVLLSATPFLDITSRQFQSVEEFPESISISADVTETIQGIFELSEETGVEEGTSFDADGQELELDIISQTPRSIAFNFSADNVSVAHSHPRLTSGTFPAFEPSVIEDDTLIESGSYSRAPSTQDMDLLRAGLAAGFPHSGDIVQADDRTYLYYATEDTPVVPGFAVTEDTQEAALDARISERIAETEIAISANSDGGSIITLEEQQRIDEQGQAAYANEFGMVLFRGETGDQADGSTQLQRIDPADTPAPLQGRQLTASIRRAEDSIARQDDSNQRFIDNIFAVGDAETSRAERKMTFEKYDREVRSLESNLREYLQLRDNPENTAETNQEIDERIEIFQERLDIAQATRDSFALAFGTVDLPEDSETV